ncbi:hypothetical protein T07_3333 [Trichinella nelsoni]|uniref:Uncharacterized protein n=1 Tax=Trichinella nelsoni TaxID=6336 RepID=A0A0V0SGB2_9BILA|nr:hypothetical protein T07_3333 [Trichinella nelsoni]
MAPFSILYAVCSSTGQSSPWGVRLITAVTSRLVVTPPLQPFLCCTKTELILNNKHIPWNIPNFSPVFQYIAICPALPSNTRDVPPRRLVTRRNSGISAITKIYNKLRNERCLTTTTQLAQ